MTQNPKENLVIMGKVVNAFGILGFIKIKTDTQATAISLSKYKSLHLKIKEQWILHQVTESFADDNILNVKLDTINDRNAALSLKTCLVGIPRAEFPKLSNPDEFYWLDLIDLTVINKAGITLGTVSTLIESAANSVLVVDGDKNHLIPFVGTYIIEVDLKQKQILVDWGIDY